MKRIGIGLILVVFLLVGAAYLYLQQSQFRVDVPEYQTPPEQLVHAEQGWTDEQRLHFHHTPQGTRLVPYAWFMALEQPCLSLIGCDLFADKTYLARFGFLASQADPKLNPDGLPVGFARQEDFYDPETKTTYPVIGLTCAACHTGGTTLRKIRGAARRRARHDQRHRISKGAGARGRFHETDSLSLWTFRKARARAESF